MLDEWMRSRERLNTDFVDGETVEGWGVAANNLQRVAASVKVAHIDAEVLEVVGRSGDVAGLHDVVHTVDLEVDGLIGGGLIAVKGLRRQIERQHTVCTRMRAGGDRCKVPGYVEVLLDVNTNTAVGVGLAIQPILRAVVEREKPWALHDKRVAGNVGPAVQTTSKGPILAIERVASVEGAVEDQVWAQRGNTHLAVVDTAVVSAPIHVATGFVLQR